MSMERVNVNVYNNYSAVVYPIFDATKCCPSPHITSVVTSTMPLRRASITRHNARGETEDMDDDEEDGS